MYQIYGTHRSKKGKKKSAILPKTFKDPFNDFYGSHCLDRHWREMGAVKMVC